MHTDADVIVVGLGAIGSAATYHLVRQGLKVRAFDRYTPPHAHGSHHGESRIIRKSYAEGSIYVPLLRRAYTLWHALEDASGQSLLTITGGIDVGARESRLIRELRDTATQFGIEHQVWSATEAQEQVPAFRVPDRQVVFWEPDAGVLDPNACLLAHRQGALQEGAHLHVDEPVQSWTAVQGGVRVTTPSTSYRADACVFCAGGWTGELLPSLDLPLTVERQVNAWFRPTAETDVHTAPSCPVFRWEDGEGRRIYGVPDLGSGVKIGGHRGGDRGGHPDELLRKSTAEDEERLRSPARRLLPSLSREAERVETCFYTNTPEYRYLLDIHPNHPQVVFAGGGSGHGFKVASALGEILADLVLGHRPEIDIQPFRLGAQR